MSEFIFDSASTMTKDNFSMLSPTPDLQDVKGVHDFRVEIRRMRSVLGSCLSLLDPTWGKNYLDELRWVDEVISPVRNVQALLDRFSSYPDSIKIRNDQLSELLRKDLKKCQMQLQLDLTLPAFQQFLSFLNFETQESIPCSHSNELVINYLERFNATAWETLLKAAVKADEDHLHEVRIKAKKVKYLAEASIPVIGKSLRNHVKIASNIQSTLGYLQDSKMMTASADSVEILEYEKKQRKKIKNDWKKFVKRNF